MVGIKLSTACEKALWDEKQRERLGYVKAVPSVMFVGHSIVFESSYIDFTLF